MRTVKIGSARELEKFLKILAEESVTLAKREPEENRQKRLAKDISLGIKNLSEQDPEEVAGEKPTDKKAAAPPPPESPPEDKKVPAAPTPAEATHSDLNPTLDNLQDAIKDIRGGLGTSDSAIEAELRSYFDRLDEAEKISLVVMVRSIGAIMRQQMSGAKAPEPEQYDIVTSKKPSTSSAETPEKATPPAQAKAAAEPEDTAPPIKVGEPVSEAYRARIRNLLNRSR